MSIIPPNNPYNYFLNKYPIYDIKKSNNPFFPNVKTTTKKALCSSCISITHCVSLSKKEHQQELRKQFKDKTEYGLNASKKFLGSKSWVNDNNWTMGKIERDLGKEWQDRYIKTLNVWKEIEYMSKELDLIPIFFTGTVIGELHPFKANTDKRKENWAVKNLNKSYQELQDLHQQIRKQAKRTLGYSPMFIRAVEYHKSFMPHTHIVYFVRSSEVNTFVKIIKNKEELNNNIGRTETEVLKPYNPEKAYSPVSYLLKYLKKNITDLTKTGSEEDLAIFNGWKNTLGIKQLYNNSLYKIPKWAIKKISYYFKNFEELGYRSMLEAIEKEVEITNISVQLDGSEKTKIVNKPLNPSFSIFRKIEKYKYINKEDETDIADKVIEYLIYDKNGIVIFDKKDYVLIEDSSLSRYRELTKLEQLKAFQLKRFLLSEKLFDFLYSDIKYKVMNNVDYGVDYLETPQHLEYDILPSGCI
jgi:hypothetical protein